MAGYIPETSGAKKGAELENDMAALCAFSADVFRTAKQWRSGCSRRAEKPDTCTSKRVEQPDHLKRPHSRTASSPPSFQGLFSEVMRVSRRRFSPGPVGAVVGSNGDVTEELPLGFLTARLCKGTRRQNGHSI